MVHAVKSNNWEIEFPGGGSQILNDGYWPTHILWKGLVVNSLFWGLLLATPQLTLLGLRAGRTRRRRRRGACLHCGYLRTGLAPEKPCPECGRPGENSSEQTQPANK